MHLARHAAHVTVLVRGGSIADTMSDYLIRELDNADNVDVRLNTEIVDARGEFRLALQNHVAPPGKEATVLVRLGDGREFEVPVTPPADGAVTPRLHSRSSRLPERAASVTALLSALASRFRLATPAGA